MRVFLVDAFTDKQFNGNTAGVVFNDTDIEIEEMQQIACELNMSETVFITILPNKANYRLQYFTPTQEIPYCGHTTIAASWVISKAIADDKNELIFETKIGNITVFLDKDEDAVFISQEYTPYKKFTGDVASLFTALGLDKAHIDGDLILGFNGSWDLFIPVKDKEVIFNINPNYQLLKYHNLKHDIISVHMYCLDEANPEHLIIARNFGPAVGIPEDFVTGSANGSLVSFLAKENMLKVNKFKILQGNPRIRMGEVMVKTSPTIIKIGGSAVISLEGNIGG